MVPSVLEAGILRNPHLLKRQSVESKISSYILVPYCSVDSHGQNERSPSGSLSRRPYPRAETCEFMRTIF